MSRRKITQLRPKPGVRLKGWWGQRAGTGQREETSEKLPSSEEQKYCTKGRETAGSTNGMVGKGHPTPGKKIGGATKSGMFWGGVFGVGGTEKDAFLKGKLRAGTKTAFPVP